MAKLFLPRTGTTAISTAIFKPFIFPKFPKFPKPRVIAFPSPGRGFPPAPPKRVTPPLTFQKPIRLGLPKRFVPPIKIPVPVVVPAQPAFVPPATSPGGIMTKPLQKTSGVIQSSGSGIGRLKSTFSFAFTPEGKLNIPLLALGIAAAGLLIRK